MAEHHDAVRFEPTDVNVNPVVWFLVILSASLVGSMTLLWVMQGYFVAREEAGKRPENPLAVTLHGQLPPEPRIEGWDAGHSVNRPTAAGQRAQEAAGLKSGWKDAAGKWHPPIDEAIKLVVQKESKK